MSISHPYNWHDSPRRRQCNKNPAIIIVGKEKLLFIKNITNSIPHYKFTCKNCKNIGHASAFCSLNTCSHCGKRGHSSMQCIKRCLQVRSNKTKRDPKPSTFASSK